MPLPILSLFAAGIAFLIVPVTPADAKAVISEVHWAGSDFSASDEWLEIGESDPGPGSGTGPGTALGGWTLTSVNSSGIEVVLFTFPGDTVLLPGEYLIISHFGASQSRLLSEPAFVAPAVSLPNTKLLLRLRDASGQVMDEVDDGVGAPLAGENLSSPVRKSSMERIDLFGSGTDSANWETAVRAVGIDDGAPVMATPGFPREEGLFENSSSAVSSVSTVTSSSSVPSVPSAPSVPPAPSSSASSLSQASASSSGVSSSSPSCPAFDPYIALQSGVTVAEEKVTLNIQILQRYGSLGSAVCSVDFGDGAVMPSCNPSAHSYDRVGSYTIRADVRSSCGETLSRTLSVSVLPKGGAVQPASDSIPSAQTAAGDQPSGGEKPVTDRRPVSAPSDGFILNAVLPNPAGKDGGKEWVEIINTSAGTADLEGWSLRLPHAKKGKFTFGSVGFAPREAKRFSDTALGMTLGNASGELSLVDPSGSPVAVLTWKDIRDGVIVRPPVAQRGSIRARVTHVLDGDTMDVVVPGTVDRTERVRLIGIDAPELHSSDPTQVMLGKRAADFLRQLVIGDEVILAQGPDERDAYGRVLAYVQTADGDLLQEIILREGLATVYLKYPFAREAEFLGYQQEAQEILSGIWSVLGIATRAHAEERKEEQIMYSNILTATAAAEPSFSAASTRSPYGPEPAPEPESVLFSVPGTLTATTEPKKKSSSSRKSAAPKKKASSSKKAKSAKKSSSSKKSGSEPAFTPLHSAMTPELLALNALIQPQDEETKIPEEVEEDEPGFPFVTLGIALSGAISAGGGVGWTLAKRREGKSS